MKIGILTYHWAVNYGAALQAYALWRHLSEIDSLDVDVIDFSPPSLENFYGANPLQAGLPLRDRVGRVLYHRRKSFRQKMFRQFLESNVSLSPRVTTIEELEQITGQYDVLISGSDQVWNPDICHEHLSAYLQNFPYEGKRAAYAASFGADWVKDRYKELMGESLSRFSAISTREKAGAEIVKTLIDRDVASVMDPVFLLSQEVWRSFDFPARLNQDYIFLYSLQKTPGFLEKLNVIQNQLQIPILDVLPRNARKQAQAVTPYSFYDVSPLEWVSLLNGAKAVVTDSFHCSAFSVLLEKPFISFRHSKRDDRVESLLTLTGLPKKQFSLDEPLPDVIEHFNQTPEGSYNNLKPEIDRSNSFLESTCE